MKNKNKLLIEEIKSQLDQNILKNMPDLLRDSFDQWALATIKATLEKTSQIPKEDVRLQSAMIMLTAKYRRINQLLNVLVNNKADDNTALFEGLLELI